MPPQAGCTGGDGRAARLSTGRTGWAAEQRLTLLNLRPRPQAANMALGSSGKSLAQGWAGLPLLCRHLPSR